MIPGEGPARHAAQQDWVALMMGWIPPITIPWSANLLVLAGWILFRQRRYDIAYRLGVIAFLAALTTLLLADLAALMVGYYLWQASSLAFTICAYCAKGEARGKVDRSVQFVELP